MLSRSDAFLDELGGDISEPEIEAKIDEWFSANAANLKSKLDGYVYSIRNDEARAALLLAQAAEYKKEITRLTNLANTHTINAERTLRWAGDDAATAKKYHTTRVEFDEDGRPSKQVQVQYPKLEITVLDGSQYTYHDLAPVVAVNPSHTSLSQFTVGDLFAHYSQGMMRAFRERCPVLHDPADPTHHLELPTFPRRLFAARSTAGRPAPQLLGM